MSKEIRKVGIYGTGKVALSIGKYLISRGFEVGYCGRSIELAQRYISGIGALRFVSVDDLLEWCDAIGFVVTDRAVHTVSSGLIASDKYAFHMSGALAADEIGGDFAAKFSLHPLRAFAQIESDLSGTVFALEIHENTGSPFIREIDRFAKEFGRVIRLKSEDKVLYHAAAVVASNLIVPLVDQANRLLHRIGIDDEDLLWPLIDTAVSNMKTLGVKNSLTGPVARGDVGVIERHMAEIANQQHSALQIYRVLSLAAIELAPVSEELKKQVKESLEKKQEGEV